MVKSKDDIPSFDELPPLGDDLAAADGAALGNDLAAVEPAADELAASASSPVESDAAEATETPKAPIVDEKDAWAEEPAKRPSKLPLYLELLALVAVPLALLALAGKDLGILGLNYLSIWTAIYLIGLGLIGYAIWKSRATSTLYTVFLGCVLAGMLTGIYCLWMELAVNYKFDVKAREAKQKVSMTLPADSVAQHFVA
ncbi:MAG: hypothetical protein LLG00_05490 [Planctomycetaceae bacterium]|nr:hypothetical protein [Planctomycetaceae bacterium]